MKKLLVFLCIGIMMLGAIGCKRSGSSHTSNSSGLVATVESNPESENERSVPEPATILLLGSGLVGLAGIGRKKFFDKDKDIG